MPQKELEEALHKLTEELKNIDQNDLKSREMLEKLVTSIEQKLKEPDNKDQNSQLIQKLEEKTAHFEVSHPLISRTIEDIIAILVRIGI